MRFMILFLLAFLLTSSDAEARPFALDAAYTRPDGAILTFAGATTVDPYFPTRALLLAEDNGLDIRELGNRWVAWMLSRQGKDGLFSRYCFKDAVPDYSVCAD